MEAQTPASTRCLPFHHASAWPHLTEEGLLSMRKKSSFAFWGGRMKGHGGAALPARLPLSTLPYLLPPIKGPVRPSSLALPPHTTPPSRPAQDPGICSHCPPLRLPFVYPAAVAHVDLSQFCTSRHGTYLKYTSHFLTCYLSTYHVPPTFLPGLLCRRPIP